MPETKRASRDPDAVCLGSILKRLRMQRGWTIRQLAEKIRMHPTHLGVVERGGNFIHMNWFLNIVDVLDADAGEIVREVLANRRSYMNAAPSPPPPPLEQPAE